MNPDEETEKFVYLEVHLRGGRDALAVRRVAARGGAELWGARAARVCVLATSLCACGTRAVLRTTAASAVTTRAALSLCDARVTHSAASLLALRNSPCPTSQQLKFQACQENSCHLVTLPVMSERACEGDSLLVLSRSEHAAPSRVALPPPPEREGLVRADGSINWACPCLGGMAAGPCGESFRDAFSCFHYSAADPKGSDCYDKFSDMQSCMADYPKLYGDDPALPGQGDGDDPALPGQGDGDDPALPGQGDGDDPALPGQGEGDARSTASAGDAGSTGNG